MFAERKHHKCIRHVIRNMEEAVVLQEGRRGQGIVYATWLLQAFRNAHALCIVDLVLVTSPWPSTRAPGTPSRPA